jgi:hypothetical protein
MNATRIIALLQKNMESVGAEARAITAQPHDPLVDRMQQNASLTVRQK